MRYVLDSNVGLKWFLTEIDSDKAIRIRDEYRRQVHDLIAPDVFPVEIAHSLTRAQRQGRITIAEGQSHFRDMIATLPMLYPSLPLLPRAFELSSLARIGVYDCLYAALIEREGCDLITADDRLKRSLPSHGIILLSSMP
jgi:predicted nucleic acid-binding protein